MPSGETRREKGGRVEAEKILECIPIGSQNPIKRSELADRIGLTDRDTRDLLHQAKRIMPIINMQDGKGYYIPDMNVPKDRRLLLLWTKQELSRAKEIIVPFPIDMELEGVNITIPQRGDKKKLLDLSIMNGKQYKIDKLKQAEKLNPEQRNTRLLKEIQEMLHLKELPVQIECFDNSNIQGSDAVAACVVFKMGKPSKQDYRKYNIRTVVGPDDYASMKEVVRRRYQRAIDEQAPLPNLIITDGGKGQMEVVRSVIEDELHLSIPIAGLAKDSHHRTAELLFGFPPEVIGMKLDSPLFHLLTRIQDEVHRFAITFHRNKRSKKQNHSELDDIKGIGEKSKTVLLKKFKSVKRIKEASLEELGEVIGQAKAKQLKEGLNITIK